MNGGTPREQARDPLGAYGRTKAAGEEAVEQVLGGSGRGVMGGGRPGGLPHQHRHPGGGLLAGDHG